MNSNTSTDAPADANAPTCDGRDCGIDINGESYHCPFCCSIARPKGWLPPVERSATVQNVERERRSQMIETENDR
jgi:hypothetical protein